MDLETGKKVVDFLSEGGSSAIIAILFAVILALVWDRKTLVKSVDTTTQRVFEAKDNELKSIKEIIDKYHQGHMDLIQALNEIRVVLSTIKSGN
jgi:cellobiose-specific phosphotransferase system component IIA